jgi:hypothetical protein
MTFEYSPFVREVQVQIAPANLQAGMVLQVAASVPRSVFTPAAPARGNMYVARQPRTQGLLDDLLHEPGRQIVLYGPTGIGKTSLIQNAVETAKLKYLLVQCGPPFDDVVRDVLGRLGQRLELEQTREYSAEGQAEAGLLGFIKGIFRSVYRHQTTTAPLPKLPHEQLVDELARHHYRVLVLDNYENLLRKDHAHATERALSELLKLCADRGSESVSAAKVVIVGIADATRRLLDLDEATSRRTAQMEVPRMSAAELNEIISRGASELGVEYTEECRNAIVAYSDGFPWMTHLYAQHCALRYEQRSRTAYAQYLKRFPGQSNDASGHARETVRSVDRTDFTSALRDVVGLCSVTIGQKIDSAVQHGISSRGRRAILAALAYGRDMDRVGLVEKARFLWRASGLSLHRLTSAIISDAIADLIEVGALHEWTPLGEARTMYHFANPLMRAYVWSCISNVQYAAGPGVTETFTPSPYDASVRAWLEGAVNPMDT